MIGRTLAQYRILDRLGAGGMGEVWRAHDDTLGRDVAIKVLPPEVASDPERLARFEREAKLLASVNHPGIATVHGLQEADGVRFLAMELVPGETLATRIARRRPMLEESLSIAREVASALGAAHSRGVIHRDLKPANILITPEGRTKVLDFGLAKAVGESAVPEAQDSATLTSAGSVAGAIVGTVAYMSPEQARGLPVDRRTDVWAFGCVLYEMLSGSQLFGGATVSDTLAAVLRAEPDWSALPADTPPSIRRLLHRCLVKDPERRLHDIADARLEIDDAGLAGEASALASAPPRPAGRLVPWALAILFAVAAAATLAAGFLGSGRTSRAPLHVAVMLPQDLDLVPGVGADGIVAISTDARKLAIVARRDDSVRLYLRSLDSPDLREVPGTGGATGPFFSPDGRWLGFFAGGKLKKVAVEGGMPIVLGDAPTSRGGTWPVDDTIVFAPAFTSGLVTISASGGEPKVLTTPDASKHERTHRWPSTIPGGRSVVFTIGSLDKPGDYEDAVIAVADLRTGEVRKVLEGASMAACASSGHLLYARGGSIAAVPFDHERGSVTGAPTTVLKGVEGDASSGIAYFALAADGTLVFMPLGTESMDGTLMWVDRTGRVEDLPLEPRRYRNPRISPDGKRIVFNIGPGAGDNDAWIYDLDRAALTRFSFDKASYRPIFTPDGRRITFASTTGGKEGLAWKMADGSEDARVFLSQSGIYTSVPDAWAPGSGELLFTRLGGAGGSDVLSVVPGGAEKAVLTGPDAEGGATLSPDGKWMAYTSDESGRLEVYVRAHPGPGGRWQISPDGGRGARWSADGSEIFYVHGYRMMAVPVTTTTTLAPGPPRQLFEVRFERVPGGLADYDVTADGRRFLFVRPLRQDRHQLDLIQGFSVARR